MSAKRMAVSKRVHGPRSTVHRQRGVHLTELAIFGGITVAAVGFLLRAGLTMNYEQEVRMAAFRRCLHAARGDDSTFDDAVGTSVLVHQSRMSVNPGGGMSSPRFDTLASAYCVAGDRLTFAYQDDVADVAPGQQRMVVYSNAATPVFLRQEDFPTGWSAVASFVRTINSGNTSFESQWQFKPGRGWVTTAGTSGNTTTTVGIGLATEDLDGIGSTVTSSQEVTARWRWEPEKP